MRYEIQGPRYEKSDLTPRFFPSSLASRTSSLPLYRLRPLLPGADADHLLHGIDEDLAVADLAGARRARDGLDAALDLVVLHHQLDLHLGQEIHHVLRAAVQLGVALLPPEALDLGHGKPAHARLGERRAHVIEFERLDDRFDFFHRHCLRSLLAVNEYEFSTQSRKDAKIYSLKGTSKNSRYSRYIRPT